MLYPLHLLEGFAAMICTKLADNKEEEVPLQVVRLLLVLLDQASYVVMGSPPQHAPASRLSLLSENCGLRDIGSARGYTNVFATFAASFSVCRSTSAWYNFPCLHPRLLSSMLDTQTFPTTAQRLDI